MKLILFRHGLAMAREDAAAQKVDDSLRPLVEKGRERSRRMARVLRDCGGDFQALVSSPFTRSMETARILKEVISFKEFHESLELVPDSPPQALARWIAMTLPRATHVVAVGHEPQLSSFASWLLAGDPEGFIDLKKSGILCLEVESFDRLGPRSAELKWLLSPKLFS